MLLIFYFMDRVKQLTRLNSYYELKLLNLFENKFCPHDPVNVISKGCFYPRIIRFHNFYTKKIYNLMNFL